ncbi:tryptophan-rich sensory protein [Tardiphaga alba]|uniref:Tryptophan-rich sensory protein n=1 Tax=Tardiphaga alba TaxID=340268 RepID=A0ABX8AGA2_9BRAD|nr:tryptophan-rich sensory protein [Tardiphaga alba]
MIALAVALAACFAVAALGATVTTPEIPTWYAGLQKPSWTPPRIAFPIVWPILYFLMAIAVWRFWEAMPSRARTAALLLFVVQLALNAIWSQVFFGLHSIAGGLVVILLLDLVLAATIVVGSRVDRIAAGLLLPYIAWTIFATALNGRIWMIN